MTCTRGASALAIAAALGLGTSAFGQCGGSMVATPVPGGPFVVGQSLQLQATFGPQGANATINAVVINLECQNAGGCGNPCTDDGMVLQYNGDDTIVSNTCGQAVSTGLGDGDTFTNTITFTFANPIVLNDGQTCSFRFGVTVASHSNDMTPNAITGTAQTQGTCSNGLPLAACGSYLIPIANPAIHIEKTVNPTSACEGSQVTYTYAVTNTGDVPLSNIVVVDDNGTPGDTGDDFNPMFTGGDTNGNSQLDLTETWTYTHQSTPPIGITTNIAVVTGTYASAQGNVNVMDDDDATVEIFPNPSCSIRTMPGNCETTYCGDTDGCDPSYHWTGPGGFTADTECITLDANSAAGEYCLMITDCNGCTSGGPGSMCCINFIPPVAPTCTIDVGACPFPRLLTVNTQNCNNCTYQWGVGTAGNCSPIQGETGNTLLVDTPGDYCVTITSHCFPGLIGGVCNNDGCTSTCSVNVPVCETPPGFCRVTGGGWSLGVDYARHPDATVLNRHSRGGQAGAPASSPNGQDFGEWTHVQHEGPAGWWTFHGGTHSAPPGTEILTINCCDPDPVCHAQANAHFKQIDFTGVGTFKNIHVQDFGPGNTASTNGANRTYHYFTVHIEDLGEPGSQHADPGANCPPEGSNCEIADCGCLDFYHFTLYKGVVPDPKPTNSNPHIDPSQLNTTVKIYEVYGYVNGGNFQIHPAIGDLDGNGTVNLNDLNMLLGRYGPADGYGIGDLDFDKDVDGNDVAILLIHWGPVLNH